jgi:biopolymer transport protein ExbB/TolQ
MINMNISRVEIFKNDYRTMSPVALYKKHISLQNNPLCYSLSLIMKEWNSVIIRTKQDDIKLTSRINHAMSISVTETRKSLSSMESVLSAFAALSPLLGLFGTVIGVIEVFAGVIESKSSNANLSLIAPGVSDALITTAIGIFVAIENAVMHSVLSSKRKYIENENKIFFSSFSCLILTEYARTLQSYKNSTEAYDEPTESSDEEEDEKDDSKASEEASDDYDDTDEDEETNDETDDDDLDDTYSDDGGAKKNEEKKEESKIIDDYTLDDL